jgi:cytochrome c553
LRLLRVLRAVFWSILGVRRRADAARDLEGVPPHVMIAAGVVVAALFVTGIVLLVRVIIGHSSAPAPVDAGAQRSPTRQAVASAPHGPVEVPDTLAERVRPCTVCHGSATQATNDGFSPRIAGKPAGYLFNQLVSFREGRRTYPAMVYLVQYMTDDYLREMATYFAQLDLPYPAPEPDPLSAAQAARARDIVEHGDANRRVPACVECHGPGLTGVDPAIPAIVGLPRHYMNAQFGAWRGGKLRSIEPDCMAEVARRLAPEDVPVLTAWLAAQAVPAGMKPEPARTRALPLECGSVQAATR